MSDGVSLVVFLTLAVYGLVRIRYGIDYTDEGLYLSSGLRFALGDSPFFRSGISYSFFDLLLWPFFALFPKAGVYEARALGIGLQLVSMVALYRLFRPYAPGWILALACASTAFMGYGIFTPAYNKMGQTFAILGPALWLMGCQAHGVLVPLLGIVGGCCFLLGAAAYNPLCLLLALPVCALLNILIHQRGNRLSLYLPTPPPRALTATLTCLGTIVLPAFAGLTAASFLAPDRFDISALAMAIPRAANAAYATLAGLGDKLHLILPQIAQGATAITASTTLGLALTGRSTSTTSMVAAVALGIVLIPYGSLGMPLTPWPESPASFWILATATGLGIAAYINTGSKRIPTTTKGPRQRHWAFLLLFFTATALVYALIQPAFSTNGPRNARFAAAGLMLPAVACLSRVVLSQANARIRLVLLGLALALLGIWNLSENWHTVYRDGPITTLTATVNHPKLRHIRTTPQRAAELTALLHFLEPRLTPGETLLMLDDIPLIYFLTGTRPSMARAWTPTRWKMHEYVNKRLLKQMDIMGRTPNWAIWHGVRNPEDIKARYILDNYQPAAVLGPFTVFERER